jgi:hypothetical protein
VSASPSVSPSLFLSWVRTAGLLSPIGRSPHAKCCFLLALLFFPGVVALSDMALLVGDCDVFRIVRGVGDASLLVHRRARVQSFLPFNQPTAFEASTAMAIRLSGLMNQCCCPMAPCVRLCHTKLCANRDGSMAVTSYRAMMSSPLAVFF